MIEVSGLRKAYPGVVALDGVSLQIRPGEVVGLAGENGAGKSTLLKALVGLVRPDEGTISVRGRQVRLRGVAEAAAHGIGMVFQEQSLVPNLTAAENILLGCEGSGVRLGVYRWRRLRELAQAQLDKIGSRVDPMARTETRASPSGRWWRSPRCWPSRSAPRSRPWCCSTSPPRCWRPRRSRPCSRRSSGCASTPRWSSSPTGWTRCSRSATGSTCCAADRSRERSTRPPPTPPTCTG
ncbi:ATP-binding cassette domain-containing protein [Thermocatellispora tengchongensis]|uniref:ATP-binding cassette domain-containing protein n=1 Tax=Thermocatellispora tengchongensis TaxID=1073253 RepID=UPI003633D760